jgi:hypothetical protein
MKKSSSGNLMNVVVFTVFLVGDICLLGSLICGMIAGFVICYKMIVLSLSESFLLKILTTGLSLFVSVFVLWVGGILLAYNLNWIQDFWKEAFKKDNKLNSAPIPA